MSEASKERIGWFLLVAGLCLVVGAVVLGQALSIIWAGLRWPVSGWLMVGFMGMDLLALGGVRLWYARWRTRRTRAVLLVVGRGYDSAGSMRRYGMDTARQQADDTFGR